MIFDKITTNSYNTGDMDFQEFTSPIALNDNISSRYEEYSLDATDYKIKKQLENALYEIFINSEYYEKYKTPRNLDKNDLLTMYYYFKDILVLENIFSPIDIFKGFAEFFEVNYNILYSKISIKDKESILKEINDTIQIKNKVKTKKLF